jgi:hypothetical protein
MRLHALVTGTLIGWLTYGVPAWAQTIPLDPGPFPPVRYEENYRKLADPAVRTGFFDPLKYIPLGADPDYYISFGGEVRERYEHYTNEIFGIVGKAREDYLLSRVLLHADVHLGTDVRAFVQFGSEQAPGRVFTTPVDRDDFDLAQAFIDLSTATDIGADLTLRAGRQEILLGSGRFIDIREGPNTRQSHDGLRTFATFANGARIDAFLVRPVAIKPGTFDDYPDHHQLFGGVYGTVPLDPSHHVNLDAYYFYLQTQNIQFVAGAPNDYRHTLGARVWGRYGQWDYDSDFLFQTGTQGASDIRAGGVAAKAGYSLSDFWWRPRLGVQADYFSGGQGGNGRTVSTFNPLFPRGGYFSEPGLQSFQNLIDVYPSVTFNPIDTLAIMTGVDFTWRANNRDFVYISPNVPIPGTAGSRGNYIGTNYVVQASWTATPNISVNGSYVHLAAGPAITSARGKNVDYFAFWTSLKF